jgi:hypothetical protein
MQLHAARAERERVVTPRPPLSQAGGWQALLLSESRALLAGPPPLFQALSSRERELVLSHGRRRVQNTFQPGHAA